MKFDRTTILCVATAIFFLALLMASYGRYYFFVFDDTALLVQARDTSLSQLLHQQTSGFWRPGGMITHKVNLALSGWSGESAFALVGLVMHVASSVLLFTLVRQLAFGRFAACVSGLLFLASPWASESLMWMSAQFDVFAVFFTLLALCSITLMFQSDSGQRRAVFWVLITVSTLIALLYKENAIVIPVLAAFVAIREQQLQKAGHGWLRVIAVVLVTSVVALIYLGARNIVMDGLNGPYGSASSMWEGKNIWTNVWSYIESLTLMTSRLPADIRFAALIFFIFVVISVISSFRRPIVALTLMLSLLITILPTAWSSVPSETTVASRFAYLPGMAWSVLIGFGAAQVWVVISNLSRMRLRSLLRTLWVATTAFALVLVVAATYYQSLWWRFAVVSAKEVVDFIEQSEAAASPCIYVTNLPSATFEGPHILKSYNVGHHFATRGANVPRVRSDQVVISRYDGLVSIPQPEGFSEACDGSSEVTLTLPLQDLRP